MMSNYSISIRTFRTKNYCYSTTSPVQSTSSSASELQYIQYSHIGSHYLFSKKQCEQHVFASVHGHSSTLLVPVFTVHVLCVCGRVYRERVYRRRTSCNGDVLPQRRYDWLRTSASLSGPSATVTRYPLLFLSSLQF